MWGCIWKIICCVVPEQMFSFLLNHINIIYLEKYILKDKTLVKRTTDLATFCRKTKVASSVCPTNWISGDLLFNKERLLYR